MSGKARQPGKAGGNRQQELIVRTASALVMATLACLATYAGVIPFALMIAVGSLILAWEWGKLVRGKSSDLTFYAHAGATIIACGIAVTYGGWISLIALLAGAGITAFLIKDSHARLWSAFGVLYLGLPVLFLIWFRADPELGIMVIFFLFMIVWSADTAAYFTGRAIGGPKLAPSISPGKTWAGFAGGLITPALLASGFALWIGNTSALVLGAVGAALAIASHMGDLVESAIKRKFHAKDSGSILPGHGGLFDRVDGLIGASIVAGGIAVLRSVHEPGKALLIWP